MSVEEGAALDVDVVWEDNGWPEGELCKDLALRAARLAYSDAATEAAVAARAKAAELSLVFANDERVRELNFNWRGQDKSTNVLSFPAFDEMSLPDAPNLLGDIVLARQTVLAEAAQQDKPLTHHVAHLVCHGMLHLLDYDHLTDNDAEQMESLETAILAKLEIPDPYADE